MNGLKRVLDVEAFGTVIYRFSFSDDCLILQESPSCQSSTKREDRTSIMTSTRNCDTLGTGETTSDSRSAGKLARIIVYSGI